MKRINDFRTEASSDPSLHPRHSVTRSNPGLHRSEHEHERGHDTVFVCTELPRNIAYDPERGHVLVNHTGSHSYKIVDLMKDGSTTTTPVPLPPFHTLAEHKPLPCISSAEGLIVLWWPCSQVLSVCNPVTREYVRVAIPEEINPANIRYPITHRRRVEHDDVSYGFGVSRKSKQYKLVWIVRGQKCQVHTLATGQWRVGWSPPKIEGKQECASVGGKLHWLQNWEKVCSFNLESEVFTGFSAPPRPNGSRRLCVLEECLCVCDYDEDGIRIWIMRGEGDWSVQFVIPKNMVLRDMKRALPIKVMDSIACHFKPSFVSLKTLLEHQEFIYSS
ncbi:hypothetical protein AAHA92_24903 [Salvia divinorum]|uniref:F-box associated beta-propeller type 1 domain-containing protein n=1 Tax=Salvia divinorum TaxID=28513 RepID=A0ABD1GBZ7_SALDI